MHLEQVCSGASSWGAGAWYHKDINISFNCKLLSLSMTSSGIRPEFPLSLKSKTGIVFRITIPVCSDELKEDWKENRCKQIILDVRGIRVTQRKLLWEFWVPLRGEKYICNKQRKKNIIEALKDANKSTQIPDMPQCLSVTSLYEVHCSCPSGCHAGIANNLETNYLEREKKGYGIQKCNKSFGAWSGVEEILANVSRSKQI